MNDVRREPFRVLLATDDSPSARNAETWVAHARWPEPCVVDVLCVASHGVGRRGWPTPSDRSAVSRAIERLRESEVMAAERISNEVAIRLQHAGLTTQSWARQSEVWTHQGNVASEILATVDLDRPDVVVVGPRGRSGLIQLLLGSVSRRLIAESRSPVLVARKPGFVDDQRLPRCLLVLVDGTQATVGAIDWLISSGWATGSRVTLLALLGFPPGVEFDDPELVSQVNQALQSDAAAMLEELTARLIAHGSEVDPKFEQGHPHEAAVRVAEQLEPDAIVVARPSGQRANEPFAENVARYASLSTLVVPEP